MSHLRNYQIQLADIPYLGSIRVLCMDGMPVYHIPAVLTEMPDLAPYVLQTVYMHFRLMEEMIQSFLLRTHTLNYLFLHQKQIPAYVL